MLASPYIHFGGSRLRLRLIFIDRETVYSQRTDFSRVLAQDIDCLSCLTQDVDFGDGEKTHNGVRRLAVILSDSDLSVTEA